MVFSEAAAGFQCRTGRPRSLTSAPASSAEMPAGRPLNPSPMQAGTPETRESILVSADWLKARFPHCEILKYNKIQGQPFLVGELVEAIRKEM